MNAASNVSALVYGRPVLAATMFFSVSVNTLLYTTVMVAETAPDHADAVPAFIPPRYTKGELLTPS